MSGLKEFTTTEYIAHHNLDIDPQDPRDTKLLAQHLRERGYRKKTIRKGNSTASVWFKASDDEKRRMALKARLDSLPQEE